MKKSVLIFTWGLLLSTLSMAGPIKIVVYGAGGIVYTGEKSLLCPNPSDCKCSDVTMDAAKIAEYEEGRIDEIPATLSMGNLKAEIRIHSFEEFEYDHKTVTVFESPEYIGYKEYGLGKASGISFSWTSPVNLMPYEEPNDIPVEMDYIKVNFSGQGGIQKTGDKVVVCPQKNDRLCATIEGDLWDIFNLWWDSWKPADSGNGTVTLTTYEAEKPSHQFKALVVGVDKDSQIRKTEKGYETAGSTYEFKLVE